MDCWQKDAQRDPDEIDIFTATKVALYQGAEGKNPVMEGISVGLTSHRLVIDDQSLPLKNVVKTESKSGFLTSSPKIILTVELIVEEKQAVVGTKKWSCPACEEENEGDLAKCCVCGTINPNVRQKVEPVRIPEKLVIYRLSFRSSGHKTFFEHLQAAIGKAAWKESHRKARSELESRAFVPGVAGVSSLMKKADADRSTAAKTQTEAFGDLDALMKQAGEMAKLAETIAAKLSSSSQADSLGDAEDREFRALMSDLGMTGTAAIAGKSSSYHLELAKQVSAFTVKLFGLRKVQMATLADVYCYFNRARGTDMVSPQDFSKAAEACGELKLPIVMRILSSGLVVLQSESFADDQLAERLLTDIGDSFITAGDLSASENVSMQIAAELLVSLDCAGKVCRDQAPSGPRYYPNLIIFS